MIKINDNHNFQNLLRNEEYLILFIFHNWSATSTLAKKVVEDWEILSMRKVHYIDASEMTSDDYLYQWSSNQGINKVHGNGEIFWIKQGEIVDFECISSAFSLEK